MATRSTLIGGFGSTGSPAKPAVTQAEAVGPYKLAVN